MGGVTPTLEAHRRTREDEGGEADHDRAAKVHSTETVSGHLRTMWRGGAIMIAGSVIEQALRFARGLFIARGIGAGALGSFGLLTSFESFTQLFATAGLPQTNIKFIGDCIGRGDHAGIRAVVRVTVGLTALLGGVMAVMIWGLAPLISTRIYQRPDLVLPFRITGVVLLFVALSSAFLSVFQAARWITPIVVIEKIGSPVVFLLGIVGVIIAKGDVLGVMVAYAVAGGLGSTVAGFWLLRWLPPSSGIRGPGVPLRKVITFSLTMCFLSASWLVINIADVLVLGRFVSPEELGIYIAASRTARLISMPASALNALYGPTVANLFAAHNRQALHETYVAMTSWVTWAALGVLGLIITTPDILSTAFGPAFESGNSLLFVLCAGETVRAVTIGGHNTLIMTGDQSLAAIVCAVGGLALAASSLVVAPVWKALGVAISVGLVRAGTQITTMYIAYHRLDRLSPFTFRYYWLALITLGMTPAIKLAVGGWAAPGVFLAAFALISKYGWFAPTRISKEEEHS